MFSAICSASAPQEGPEGPPKKKKRSRWGAEEDKMIIPGVPAVLPSNMNEDQQRIYLRKAVLHVSYMCLLHALSFVCCTYIHVCTTCVQC